jgi:hypothetical protein
VARRSGERFAPGSTDFIRGEEKLALLSERLFNGSGEVIQQRLADGLRRKRRVKVRAPDTGAEIFIVTARQFHG